MSKSKNLLASFISGLIKNGIASKEFRISEFDNRIKLQKYVFFAILSRVPLKRYNFSLYLRGPYSSELADDYYALDEENTKFENIKPLDLPGNFISLVKDRTTSWLEIAATMTYFINKKGYTKEETFKALKTLKEGVITEEITQEKNSATELLESIYMELKKFKIITWAQRF